MALLHETAISWGHWLFRWRSYLPLLLFVVLLPGLLTFTYPFGSHRYDLFWEMVCLAVSCLGLLIRCYTLGTVPAGTSGRNVSKQVAETLNTTGIYSVVRNPLYLGNFFMVLGLAMYVKLWWVVAIYVLAFWIFYGIIILTEESFLERKYGQAYRDWAARTPAFLPSLRLWQSPSLPFSLRTVLRKEYGSLLGMVVSFVILEAISEYVVNRRFFIDETWLGLLLVSVAAFMILRTLKKKTHLLDVEGR